MENSTLRTLIQELNERPSAGSTSHHDWHISLRHDMGWHHSLFIYRQDMPDCFLTDSFVIENHPVTDEELLRMTCCILIEVLHRDLTLPCYWSTNDVDLGGRMAELMRSYGLQIWDIPAARPEVNRGANEAYNLFMSFRAGKKWINLGNFERSDL
ncbi:hypothetical protein HYFRA_00012137 [Hymenoscyphus fraxineus]|uniref:Uncharacterized protein n=1 Tax=Hymenoscyphus fraxineus TaxID=746836 RepID=A0A9N9L774_9HELO|nr:hypothetical protein HYFRA_00012137 [Hymenoscyphus fraxineus]